jgi:nitrogen fixation protein NifU and related proteins
MESDNFDGYSAVAIDHANKPRNLGPFKDCDGHARITGPCGDTMEFWLSVSDCIVKKVSFFTDGCGSSLACGSMTCVMAEGKSVSDAAALEQKDILDALGGLPEDVRHCALLASNTLRAACEEYVKQKKDRDMQLRKQKRTCADCDIRDCLVSRRNDKNSKETQGSLFDKLTSFFRCK